MRMCAFNILLSTECNGHVHRFGQAIATLAGYNDFESSEQDSQRIVPSLLVHEVLLSTVVQAHTNLYFTQTARRR